MSERSLYGVGHYRGRLLWARASQAENETAQIVLGFDVNGYEARVYLFVTEKAVEHTRGKLERLGWKPGTLSPMVFNRAKAEALLTCKHEEYAGAWREKWEMSAPLPEIAPVFILAKMAALLGTELEAPAALAGLTPPTGDAGAEFDRHMGSPDADAPDFPPRSERKPPKPQEAAA
jgi:hypothetical protein